MNINRLIISILTTGCVTLLCAQPVDSLRHEPVLEEVTIVTVGPRRVLKAEAGGALVIDASRLGDQPSLMGSDDPVALLRTLPSVATTNELQAALNVRGGDTGANLFTTDGARVINPLHLFGLYSAFNPAFYRDFRFHAGRIPATARAATSALFAARSGVDVDTVCTGSLTAGLIESHGAIRIPVAPWRTSVAVGGRISYLDAVMPSVLKLGDSEMGYRFHDVNAAITSRISPCDLLRLSFFTNADRLRSISARNGEKEGSFGWNNYAGSALWSHGSMELLLTVSHFTNRFEMAEAAKTLNLPSSFSQYGAEFHLPVRCFNLAADITHRCASGQNSHGRSASWEADVAASRSFTFSRLTVDVGLRIGGYFNGDYRRVEPQPRVDISYDLGHRWNVGASYGRYVRFDRLVEETTAGLPADFLTCASAQLPPERVNAFELMVGAYIPGVAVSLTVEGYYRLIENTAEYVGSLLDLTNVAHNPLSDLRFGKGFATGLSISAMRQFGRLRGRLGYTLGTSRVKIPALATGYIPSSHDRLHDLNATMSFDILRSLTIAATFTHATGTPYTRAKYGYMIGENLVCEYFPHNSSRLPSYNRLDMSLSWTLHSRRLTHIFNLSAYNLTACRNVLFRYTSYSLDAGIRQRESVMKSIIPSLSYTIKF